MPCLYLNDDNTCRAKPYGVDARKLEKQTVDAICTNPLKMEECQRAIIYKAYLRAGGKS
jgi:hypothetical protein